MKEKVWIEILASLKTEVSKWNTYYAYDTENENYDKTVVYCIPSEKHEYLELIDFLKRSGIDYKITRREYSFSKSDIKNAEILELRIDGVSKESLVEDFSRQVCETCKEELPFKNIGKLYIDYKNIKKYDISETYSGDTEIIVSQFLKDKLLNAKITGIKFVPVYQIEMNDSLIEGYYHMQLEEGIGNIITPSVVDRSEKCPTCGFYKKYLCQTPLYFERNSWNGVDACFSSDWFGSPPSSQGKRVVISKNFYNVLLGNNIKHFTVWPAFFVD